MTTLYKPLAIPNLKDIQREVLKIIPFESLVELKEKGDGKGICYLHSTEYMFEHSPALSKLFEEIGIREYTEAIQIGVNFGLPQIKSGIHIDPPNFATYSINIPIVNCENTFLHFYKSDTPGETRDYPTAGRSVWAVYYKPEQCELIESHETIDPYILDMRAPHQFDNSFNTTYRYMLLCRINKHHHTANELVEKLVGGDSWTRTSNT